MIVRYPDFPAVEGKLDVPRPLVFLLGSYDPGGGESWLASAARSLDRHAGSVVYGKGVGPSFVFWFFHWLAEADLILIWIGPESNWSEFEVGWALGAYRSEAQAVRIGIDPARADLSRAIAACLRATNMHVFFHTGLEHMLAGARQDLRAMR